jgi:hypothetical protein
MTSHPNSTFKCLFSSALDILHQEDHERFLLPQCVTSTAMSRLELGSINSVPAPSQLFLCITPRLIYQNSFFGGSCGQEKSYMVCVLLQSSISYPDDSAGLASKYSKRSRLRGLQIDVAQIYVDLDFESYDACCVVHIYRRVAHVLFTFESCAHRLSRRRQCSCAWFARSHHHHHVGLQRLWLRPH